jgi:hypothetical protein
MQITPKQAVGLFVAIAGFIGSVLSILVAPNSMQVISFGLLFVTVIVLGLFLVFGNFWQKRKTERALADISHLPSQCATYTVEQANEDDVDWIAQLEADVYSKEDAIPRNVLREWYNANPLGFFVIRMNDGQRIGHIDVLPIKPRTLKQFLDGHIVERDIRGDCLYTPEERDLVKDLYIESVIIQPPKGYSGATAIVCLLSEFVPIARTICDPYKVDKVYAIAASKAGAKLMGHLGFEIRDKGDSRKDAHTLFVARFSKVAENVSKLCDERFKDRALLDQLLKRNLTQGL